MTELVKLEKPGRQLTKKGVMKIKSLLLSPAQEAAVRRVWSKEEDITGTTKFSIIAYLAMLFSITMLTANVLYKNSITAFADNIIVVGVIIMILSLIATIWNMNKILEAENKNILLSHTGISLIQEGKFLTIWFWRIMLFSFFSLYIGNGHLLTGLLLAIITLTTIGIMKSAESAVKETLKNIDQAITE